MNYYLLLSIEAFIVGVVVAIVGTLLTLLKEKCTKFKFNLNRFMILFLTGALSHILFEIVGFNKYYCKMFNKTRK